jgi:hypothetical protein
MRFLYSSSSSENVRTLRESARDLGPHGVLMERELWAG